MSFDTIELHGFASGDEIEVRSDRIDAELDAIWRGIAQRAQSGGERRIPVLRACLLNLVVHAGDELAASVARYRATALTARLPARVILVRASPDEPGEGPPRAFVAATRDASGGQVSGELVILDACGAQLDRVPAVVRATLEPDLATTLWWTGPPAPARPYVAALRDLADRVVVDTEEMADDLDVAHLFPPPGLGRLADLTWPRLAPWRTAIARAFDPPAHREFLHSLDSVSVTIGAHGATPPDASSGPLLVGWLAAALRWRGCVRGAARGVEFTRTAGAGPLSFELEACPSAHRGIVGVTFRAGDRTLRLHRSAEDLVVADVPPGFEGVRPVVFQDVDPVDALGATLLDLHGDPIGEEAVRRAAEIAAAL